MDNIYAYRSNNDLLLLAQEVAALISCAAYLATTKGEQGRMHVMSLAGIAERLSSELADSLDTGSISFAVGKDSDELTKPAPNEKKSGGLR